MKTMYKCEYCGQTYYNYDDVVKCEQTHKYVEPLWESDYRYSTDADIITHDTGDAAPTKLYAKMQLSQPDGTYKTVILGYALDTNDPQVSLVQQAYDKRQKELEEWRKDYEARKAAEAAAKEAEAEAADSKE